MNRYRLAIYVTLHEDSQKVEYYAVEESDSGGSDLWNDGFCDLSKLPSALSELSREWLSLWMGGRSPASPRGSS